MTQQPYDSTFKAMFEGREATLISYFLPDARYLKGLNIELIRSPLRADLVYQVEYKGTEHILHIEIETSGGSDMDLRMPEYYVLLHKKYAFPVISMILYPFKTSVVQSPYREFSGQEEILTFNFEVVALWKLDARKFVEQKAVSMYSFLPTMGEARADLLLQAIDELRDVYNDSQLARQLLWLKLLLHRANLLPREEIQCVEERLTMFEDLFEGDPYFQKVEARGEEKGKIAGQKVAILTIVEDQYPRLAQLAQQKVESIGEEEQLRKLLLRVYNLHDEQALRTLLTDLP